MASDWENVRRKKEYVIERLLIYARDNFKCAYCPNKCILDDTGDFAITLDHVIPQSDPKSTDNRYNLVVACRKCNSKKKNTNLNKWLEENNIDPMVIELRTNKPLDRKLEKKLLASSVKQARMLLMAMY